MSGKRWGELCTASLDDISLQLGGDLNSGLRAHANLVGRGLLPTTEKQVDEDLMSIIIEHRLCVLNTWGNSRANKCATFRNGLHRSQLDYFLVRKHAADSPVAQITAYADGPHALGDKDLDTAGGV